jgi:hypothetical protein
MRVACVVMQRNEADCLEPWLRYHGYLFGYKNLFVIDHGSELPAVIKILARYERFGVHVDRLPATADYRRKGEFVSAALQRADATGLFDIMLPLDCDEFVVMRDEAGAACCRRATLLAYLQELADEDAILTVGENFLNTLGHPGLFFALPYRKVFFTRGSYGIVDHGSHSGKSRRSDKTRPTRLVYVHFHHKRYATQRAMAREKLRPFVDVDDPVALAAFRGVGWHLVGHLLKSEAEYRSIMRPESMSIAFPAFVELLRALAIDPLFCE